MSFPTYEIRTIGDLLNVPPIDDGDEKQMPKFIEDPMRNDNENIDRSDRTNATNSGNEKP